MRLIEGGPESENPSIIPAAPPARMGWLDFFRGAAVLLMVETHVVNTFLAAEIRSTAWFPWLNYANGLVAPSFLFIAGFTQGLRWRGGTGKPVLFGRKAWRLAGIAAIGYALHFPFEHLARAHWAEANRVGTQVDVLPCLAVSLFVLLGVTWGARRFRERWRNIVWWSALSGLAGIFIWLAPGLSGWAGGIIPVRAFVNGSTGSLFPLFPWTAFVFCGALCGAVTAVPVWVRVGTVIAVGVIGQGMKNSPFSAVSPSFFIERLAWVLVLALLCEWLVRESPACWVSFAGRQSLFMYVTHLLLIAVLLGAGLPAAFNSVPTTVALVASVTAATFAVAFGKTRLSSPPA